MACPYQKPGTFTHAAAGQASALLNPSPHFLIHLRRLSGSARRCTRVALQRIHHRRGVSPAGAWPWPGTRVGRPGAADLSFERLVRGCHFYRSFSAVTAGAFPASQSSGALRRDRHVGIRCSARCAGKSSPGAWGGIFLTGYVSPRCWVEHTCRGPRGFLYGNHVRGYLVEGRLVLDRR